MRAYRSNFSFYMLLRLFLALSMLFGALPVVGQDLEVPQSYGVIELLTYDPETLEVKLEGWSLGGRDGHEPPELILSIGKQVYESTRADLSWTRRLDIPSDHPVTGGQVGLGFVWNVHLRNALPAGVHRVQLMAVFGSGPRVTLKGIATDSPVVVVQEIKRRHWRALAFVLLGIVTIVYVRRCRKGRGVARLQRCVEGACVTWGAGVMFMLLVVMGVTGSSMGVLFDSPYGKSILDVQGTSRSVLGDKSVRGDEWGVQLPNLLAQLHHEPRFPVVNELLGEAGQNMGVVHMTSVPVMQWAALARPATWGYFVLPLRQAMAWQWQLPFWTCLLALWWMLNALRPAQRGLNLALSLAFCLAPYAAAWSNWPLYVTVFPALAFLVVTHLLREASVWRGAVLGAALGWLLAGWALVLYPAWIIVVGSAMIFIGLGWCLDNRKSLRFGAAQLVALLACIAVLGALLGSWWLDTKDAIALMQATEYPGRRGAMPGGDLGWWWHLRGYHDVESMRLTGLDSNPSEASSYLILPLLMLAAVVLGFIRDARMRWTFLGCAILMACYWVYALVGIPIEVARITLWGNVPVTRMDVGFGLLIAVLFCLFASSATAPASWRGRLMIVFLSVLSGGLVLLTLSNTPVTFVPNARSPVLAAAVAIAAAFTCGWALWGRVGSAVAMMLVLYLLATLQFNPLRIAPAKVDLAQGHRPFVTDATGHAQRTLVLHGDGIGALTFAAVGIPVVNGVFYHPHRVMWERMGLGPDEWFKVNRYQHLGFYLSDDVETDRGYRIVLAGIDQVHVHVNPRRFDFSCTGAVRVAAPQQWTDALAMNPGLMQLGAYQGVVWFAARPPCQSLPSTGGT